MELYAAHFYRVTDAAIEATGRVETDLASGREAAVLACLYAHRLHDGRATASPSGVVRCPKCGQIAVVKETTK